MKNVCLSVLAVSIVSVCGGSSQVGAVLEGLLDAEVHILLRFDAMVVGWSWTENQSDGKSDYIRFCPRIRILHGVRLHCE